MEKAWRVSSAPPQKKRAADDFPEGSLPRLYGDAQRQVVLPEVPTAPGPDRVEPMVMEIDERRRSVEIDGRVLIKANATADLLIKLAKAWLRGAGEGRDPLDYPFLKSGELRKAFALGDDDAVRRRILRARALLKERFQSAGLDAEIGAALIENVQWQGYRLNPDLVTVRLAKGPT